MYQKWFFHVKILVFSSKFLFFQNQNWSKKSILCQNFGFLRSEQSSLKWYDNNDDKWHNWIDKHEYIWCFCIAGYYLYIESSSPRLLNDTARIYSPVYGADSSSGGCFTFWYHMYGSSTGKSPASTICLSQLHYYYWIQLIVLFIIYELIIIYWIEFINWSLLIWLFYLLFFLIEFSLRIWWLWTTWDRIGSLCANGNNENL